MCEEEARVMHMRPVGKAAPALSKHVGGIRLSVSDVVAVDTVMSGAVSVGLCDHLDMLSGQEVATWV